MPAIQAPAPARVRPLGPGALTYGDALARQRRIAAAVAAGGDEVVLLLEHESIYTLGRRGRAPAQASPDAPLPAPVAESDRGGLITFHGPGQAVMYPILRLRERGIRIGEWIWMLEESAIACAARFGVAARRSERGRGAWIGERKLASIGVRVERGVSTHGIALNASTDLAWFDPIEPCGLAGVRMTSLSAETGRACSAGEAGEAMADALLALLDERLDGRLEEHGT